MMCSATVATSSSWAALRVRGAHCGEAAHARRVAVLRTPATVGAEMAPPNSIATCWRAWRRLIEAWFTASLLPFQMAISPYGSRMWAPAGGVEPGERAPHVRERRVQPWQRVVGVGPRLHVNASPIAAALGRLEGRSDGDGV